MGDIGVTFDYVATGTKPISNSISYMMQSNHDASITVLDDVCRVDSCKIYESDGTTEYTGDRLTQTSLGVLTAK